MHIYSVSTQSCFGSKHRGSAPYSASCPALQTPASLGINKIEDVDTNKTQGLSIDMCIDSIDIQLSPNGSEIAVAHAKPNVCPQN